MYVCMYMYVRTYIDMYVRIHIIDTFARERQTDRQTDRQTGESKMSKIQKFYTPWSIMADKDIPFFQGIQYSTEPNMYMANHGCGVEERYKQ